MSSIKKTDKTNENGVIVYTYYELPDFSNFSNYLTQAKPLLEEVKIILSSLKDQAEASYLKQIEIADHYQKQNEILEQEKSTLQKQLEEATAEKEQLVEETKEKFQEVSDKLDKQMEDASTEITALEGHATNAIAQLSNATEQIESQKKEIDRLKDMLDRQSHTTNSSTSIYTASHELKKTYESLMGKLNSRTISSSPSSTSIISTPSNTRCNKNNNQIKIKMNTTLPYFHGRPDNNIEEWIYTANRTLDLADYTDYEKVAVATNYLRDLAAQDYMLHEKMTGKETWVEFISYMRKKYTPANQGQIIREKLKNLKQITSVKEYYVDFRKLVLQSTDMNDAEKLNSFIRGLKQSIRVHVNLQVPKTLEDAAEAATLYETVNEEIATTSRTFMANAPKQREVRQSNFNSPYKNEICCKCNRRGHIGEQCRTIKCDFCGYLGHTADKCFKNKAAQSHMALSDEDCNIITWNAIIYENEVEVALDSCAQTSIMSYKLARQLMIPINSSNNYIETSSGEKAKAYGKTDLISVEFEGIRAEVRFLITNLKSVNVLLGVDWFKQTGVILDPKNEAFILPKRIVSTNKRHMDNDEDNDLQFSMNMLSLEDEEMDYIDDYTCMDTTELDIDKMVPRSNIKKENEEKFKQIMVENKNIFAISADQLGCCKDVQFEIETTAETPIHSVPYRQPPALAKKLQEECQSLLDAGIIQPGSAGTWSSPAFIIKQKGKERMVINFKQLNKVTKLFKFPLPRIDDQLDSFQGTKHYSTIDLRKGFYQLELSKNSRMKAGFTTPFGIYEFKRLPFGLANGPAFFSSVMSNILGKYNFVRVYIDDITIASKSEDEHLEHIITVLKELQEHGLKINPDKCLQQK